MLFKIIFLTLLIGFGILQKLSAFCFLADSDTVEKKMKKGSLVALPVAFYSPETKLAFGGIAINMFQLDPLDTLTRTSNVRTAAIYTTRGQFILSVDHNIFLKDEKYQLRGNVAFLKFPDNFYGIGNDTRLEDEEVFNNNIFNFTSRLMRKVSPGVFIGGVYNLYTMFNIETESDFLLETNEVPGKNGVRLSGFGLLASLDRRDNVLNASRGYYAEFSSRFYQSYFGSNFQFQQFEFDFRKYFNLHKNHVIATQFKSEIKTGNVPFQQMAMIGGDKVLRGYYRGRYREKNLVVLQAEYRFQVCSRFGLTAFGGFGDVGDKLSDFAKDDYKYSYGGGARFTINKKERLNIRVDYGFGDGVSNFYINLAEAF
ncbi:BamA/TamA family outer membrane protein [Chondrinema litorale]|uniref:BamA/TamA family outer membrane protein n=1 Tax=Chondrinema litorale TaxID=2994555 RepID=UPI002543DE46|nr:BamA/TamA family outer membrane protein [Chondrinema litorale]UZR94784.1 BamA/TamA family outer membrane protein [Chondrinema litorale]